LTTTVTFSRCCAFSSRRPRLLSLTVTIFTWPAVIVYFASPTTTALRLPRIRVLAAT
jgi:hypothetical protein